MSPAQSTKPRPKLTRTTYGRAPLPHLHKRQDTGKLAFNGSVISTGCLIDHQIRRFGTDPATKCPQAGWGVRELPRFVIDQTMRVESIFRDVDSDGIFHCNRVSYACRRSLHAALYPFRPHAKTMADHTLKRSITTKPVTIQPPPARAMNGVARAGSFFAQEPRSA